MVNESVETVLLIDSVKASKAGMIISGESAIFSV